jgi:uncharacterized membrane-anchored protein
MTNADVVWLVINALLLVGCVVILHDGVSEYNSYKGGSFTSTLIVWGVVGTGAFAFLTLKYFGIVFAGWSFADAMRQPNIVDWATLVGIIAAIGLVLCAIIGLTATATYRHRHSRKELQQVQ